MSSPNVTESIITLQDIIVFSHRWNWASAALFIYEYFITLDDEINHFWRRKGLVSTLFLLNRYLPLLLAFGNFVLTMHPASGHGFSQDFRYLMYVADLAEFPVWAMVVSMRAFVVCSGLLQKWSAAVVVFVLYMVPLGINTYSKFAPFVPSLKFQRAATTASRTCLIAADIIVVCVTWHTMYRQHKLARQVSHVQRDKTPTSYTYILLRDGTIYFLVLIPLNVIHMVLTLFSTFSDYPGYSISVIPFFTNPITAILVSRFLVHLQEVEATRSQMSFLSPSQTGLVFRHSVSNTEDESFVTSGDMVDAGHDGV